MGGYSVLFLMTVVVGCYGALDIKKYLKVCDRNSVDVNDCMVEAVQTGIAVMAGGIPDLGVPGVDPYHQKELKVEYKNNQIAAKMSMKDIIVEGLKGATVLDARVKADDDRLHIEIDLKAPKVSVWGKYEGEGQYNALKINANGGFRTTMSNLVWTWKLDGIPEKNGTETYVRINSFYMRPDVDNMVVELTNDNPASKELISECAVLPSIPLHLLDCYRTGAPDLQAPRRLDVFLSLLKKVEQYSPLDIRLLSTALLKSLRLDGIEQSSANAVETEFVLPYRASAFQFHKYKLLMDLFLPSQNLIDVDEILRLDEKCLLHKILSSSVRQWERGDESTVCPLSSEQTQNMETASNNRINSRCPIEEGVVQTDWGTVSPGTIMAAIGASLEAQRVPVTEILNANIFKEDIAEPLMASAMQEWFDDIETFNTSVQRQVDVADIGNVWVATLAGDLAEVVVNQGPRVGSVAQRMTVGSNNRWNDTLLPRRQYIFPQNSSVIDWHLTDAEILGGIDGFILSNYVPKWVEQRRTLRLSQIIEMYYSHEGVSFDPEVKACNRQHLYTDLLKTADLFTETMRFAHVLSLRQITVYIPLEEMQRISEAAVEAFSTYVSTLLRQSHKACQVSYSVPVMDLVVATDGSWKGYDVEQFMSWIGGVLEINMQRSTISLLHGNTGAWIVPPSNNLTILFSFIANFTDEWPTRLNMPSIMSTIIEYSMNKSLIEIEKKASAGASTVVLIISPTDRPSTTEMERVRDLMASLRTSYFDVYFAYAATELTDFQNINNEYLDYSELFLSTPSTSVVDIIETVDTFLIKSTIPTRIFGAQCPFNGTEFEQIEYEDFVLPSRQTSYRIHPFYLRGQSMIQVQFRNDGQGQLMVCMWRGADVSHSCQTIAERGSYTFNMTAPCQSPDFCPPAHFITTAMTTANICAHTDCRLPHQVGYYIRQSGLRCLPLKGSGSPISISFVLISLLILYSLKIH